MNKQTALENVMNKIEAVEKRLAELKEEQQKLLKEEEEKKEEERNKIEMFIPKLGQRYWYISSIGIIEPKVSENSYIHDYRISVGNCYRTKEDAERAQKAQIRYIALKRKALEINAGSKLDWKDEYQLKHYAYYDNKHKKYESGSTRLCCRLETCFYFNTEEKVKEFIKFLTENNYKLV